MPICNKCGAEYSTPAFYCQECGAELPSETGVEPAVRPISPEEESSLTTVGYVFIGLLAFYTFIALIFDLSEMTIVITALFGFLLFLLAFMLPIPIYFNILGISSGLFNVAGFLPGFRSRTTWKAALGIFGYLLITSIILLSISGMLLPPDNIEVSEAELSTQEVTAGDPIEVSGVVENVGNETESETIELTANNEVVATEEVTLEPGERRELTFNIQLSEAGEYEIELYDSLVSTVVIYDNIALDDATLSEREVVEGQQVEVTGVVRNVGNVSDTATVDLLVDGEVADTKTIDIDPHHQKEFQFTMAFDERGDYNIELNDLLVGQLTVVEPETVDSEPVIECPRATSEFDLLTIRDVSFANVERRAIDTSLTEGADEYAREHLEIISKQVTCDYIEENEVNALAIFFWEPDQNVGTEQAFARTYWAPNGEWGDAMEVETGDYAEHDFSLTGWPKFEVTSMDAPDSVEVGEEFTIEITVKNRGIESGEFADILGDPLDTYGSISGEVDAKEETIIQSDPIKIEECPTMSEIRFSLSRYYMGTIEVEFTDPGSGDFC